MTFDPVAYRTARRDGAPELALPGKVSSYPSVKGRVMAVVVTYHPCLKRLRRLIEALAPQVFGILVIDNGSDASDIEGLLEESLAAHVELVRMGANLGLGRAQNEGIRRVRAWSSEHVLLMDQDSEPDPSMVARLREALDDREDAAAVGLTYLAHALGRRSGFVFVRGLRMRRKHCRCVTDVLEVDHLIASGSLISMRALGRIGGLREDLFIDYVDIEWGLRARAQGMRLYGVCSAGMNHRLGDGSLRILGHSIPQYSPQRIYYQVRNSLLLLREPSVPPNWKLVNLRQVVLRCMVHVFRVRPMRPYLKMIGLAVRHGMRGRSGPLSKLDPRILKDEEMV